MDDDAFWLLIAKTLGAVADSEAQLHALYDVLDLLPAEDVEAFETALQRQLKRSFTWDLWGAAYVIHGGSSDDGFQYFQRWLIAQGRETFEHALADADCLAGFIAPDQKEPCELEEFAYVAMDVWTRKTGIDAMADPASSFPHTGAAPAAQPSGTPFKDSEAHLAKRYPKLWKRFGENPLG